MSEITRRKFTALAAGACLGLSVSEPRAMTAALEGIAQSSKKGGRGRPPNIVILLADDLGYGDLSCYGHPLIRTPALDRLAAEGQRWTSFYASAPLCGPSRVALMTGRLPIRMSGTGKNEWLPFPLPTSETTLGEMLKRQGYATAYVGKWGIAGYEPSFDRPQSHPNDRGFDDFFGLIGSNDAPMRPDLKRTYENIKNATSEDFPIALYRQRSVIENPVYQPTLTNRYTEESVKWIRAHKDKPFFLFLGYTMPHVPIFRSKGFEGRSKAGVYGDVVEELDWSVGEVVKTLKEADVGDDTLVFFSSDNGAWRTYYDMGGSSGPLRDGKITSWDGGFRVPGIFSWPGTIKPAVITDIGVNIDLMQTLASVIGANLSNDRTYDSIDLSKTVLRGEASARNVWFYYGSNGTLWAARMGQYKLVLESWDSMGKEEEFEHGYSNRQVHNPPLLFDLSTDVGERLNVANRHPDVVAQIQGLIEQHRRSLNEA